MSVRESELEIALISNNELLKGLLAKCISEESESEELVMSQIRENDYLIKKAARA